MFKMDRENKIEMLHGSITRKLLLYAIPIAASSIIQQLFNATDVAVVGKFAGKDALAAVGSNSPITALFINIFVGLAVGANVVIAHYIGQQREKEINEVVHTVLKFAIICGAVVLVGGQFVARPILRLINTPADVIGDASLYLKIYFLGLPAGIIFNFGSAILRSVGDTKRPMLCLIISGVINVILNLLFVIGFDMGVSGVAIATAVANYVSAFLVLGILMREKGILNFSPARLKINGVHLYRVIAIGVPASLQSAVFCLSNIVIQSGINSFGADAIAGSATGLNFEYIAYFVANAFAQAVITFTSQNYGAGKMDRCISTVRVGLVEGMLITSCVSAVFALFATPLVGIFSSNHEVIKYAVSRIRHVTLLEALVCLYEVPGGAMRGMGHSLKPAIYTVLGSVCFRIIWMYTVFEKWRSFETLVGVYPVSWLVTTSMVLTSYILLKRKIVKKEMDQQCE